MDKTSAISVAQEVTPLRCTVYARTSSHEAEGLAYTSIDAQLDAGLAYITSQAGAGWQFSGTAYSDAEVSGAVLERPGLHRRMTAIEAGKVDVVVVLKLDRISRTVDEQGDTSSSGACTKAGPFCTRTATVSLNDG